MKFPPPRIRDFPAFEQALARALELLETVVTDDDWLRRTHQDIRAQLIEMQSFTAGGRCPTDAEIARITFGQVVARELRDDLELTRLLGHLSEYLHQWPRGVDAPTWA